MEYHKAEINKICIQYMYTVYVTLAYSCITLQSA